MGWDQAETGMEGDSGELFAATKGAVMAFTRSLALSLAPRSASTPWPPAGSGPPGASRPPTPGRTGSSARRPLARWGTPEDVARVARFLVGPDAAFLTGQVVRVNGGAVR